MIDQPRFHVNNKMQHHLMEQDGTSANSSSDVLGTPPFKGTGTRKRDSGYGTDYSPASVTSQVMRFTYDDDCDLSRQIDALNLDGEPLDNCNDNVYDEDREVEDVFASSICSPHSVSCPVAIQRPSAPINTPEDNNDTEDGEPCAIINFPYHRMLRGNHAIHCRRLRPLVSRGTQTPPQVQENGYPGNIPRFHPYPRGGAFERLRHYSDSEKVTGTSPPGALPDVVPISRDRSISLPDVPSFRRRQSELEVGRELRRISDEFHSSYSRTSRVRRRLFSDQAASFPLTSTISLSMVWTSFRQIWTRSPLSTTDTQPPPETHDHYTTQPV